MFITSLRVVFFFHNRFAFIAEISAGFPLINNKPFSASSAKLYDFIALNLI